MSRSVFARCLATLGCVAVLSALPARADDRRHGDVGAAIGAGVAGAVLGGALAGSRPAYGPRYGAPAYVEEEPVCRVVRRPVYDEDGEVVSYRTRRICD